MMSGYNVPWARNFAAPTFRVAASNTLINSRPIIFRLRSGSVTPRTFLKNTRDMDEIANDLGTTRGVDHFRMKLQPKEFAAPILQRRVTGIFRDRHRPEPRGDVGELIAVRIPHLQLRRQRREQWTRGILDAQ